LRASRTTDRKTEQINAAYVAGSSITRSDVAQRFLGGSTYEYNQCGTVATVGNVVPTLEIEVPFYHNFRYGECNTPADNTINPIRDPTFCISLTDVQDDSTDRGFVETSCATGEDFSLFFFLGGPMLMRTDVLTITPL
jgi:hypothetical protein